MEKESGNKKLVNNTSLYINNYVVPEENVTNEVYRVHKKEANEFYKKWREIRFWRLLSPEQKLRAAASP